MLTNNHARAAVEKPRRGEKQWEVGCGGLERWGGRSPGKGIINQANRTIGQEKGARTASMQGDQAHAGFTQERHCSEAV